MFIYKKTFIKFIKWVTGHKTKFLTITVVLVIFLIARFNHLFGGRLFLGVVVDSGNYPSRRCENVSGSNVNICRYSGNIEIRIRDRGSILVYIDDLDVRTWSEKPNFEIMGDYKDTAKSCVSHGTLVGFDGRVIKVGDQVLVFVEKTDPIFSVYSTCNSPLFFVMKLN